MKLKQITFFEMTLRDNVYIKDLMNNEQSVGYWKYIIGGFEYYIPNHGFLLLIDSSYKDIEQDTISGGVWSKPDDKINKEIFKVYGNVDPNFDNKKLEVIPSTTLTHEETFNNMHLNNLKSNFWKLNNIINLVSRLG